MTVARVRLAGAMHAVVTGVDDLVSPGLSGPARSRVEGDTFVVVPDEPDAITEVRSTPGVNVTVRIGTGATPPVHVRVPRGLAIHAELSAGTIDVAALSGPLHIRLRGGSVRIDACDGPVDVDLGAGTVVAALRVTEPSRVRCGAGSVRIALLEGSNATARVAGRDESDAVVVGDGAAPLDVEVTAGHAEVHATA